MPHSLSADTIGILLLIGRIIVGGYFLLEPPTTLYK